MKKEEILERIKEDEVKYILLQFSDINGNVKSITIPKEKLSDSIVNGTWFDGSSIHGFARIHESDMYLKPDLNTYAVIPFLDSENGKTARFICNIFTPDGEPFEGGKYLLPLFGCQSWSIVMNPEAHDVV